MALTEACLNIYAKFSGISDPERFLVEKQNRLKLASTIERVSLLLFR